MAADHTDLPPGYYDSDCTSKSNDPASAPPTPPKDSPIQIYYRLYCLDGAIPSKRAYPGGSPFVGRIKATSAYSRASMRGMQCGGAGVLLTGELGATPDTPLALVFHAELPTATTQISSSSFDDSTPGMSSKYLYYRYILRAFDVTEPALGRVERILVTPPRDVSSVKRHIAKTEGKPIYLFADLLKEMSAASALPEDALLLNTSGATAHDPILLVQPERRAGLHNRPLWSFLIRTRRDMDLGPSRWLSSSAGDIVHTDGIRRVEEDGWGKLTPAYMGVDRKGKTGRFLDEPDSEDSGGAISSSTSVAISIRGPENKEGQRRSCQ
ncbi:hypothetical protein B0H13DRAFT_2096319 [Mycena leptocephala]|nr:hypothetical protein B0H13DRAFT_2096319 [Mycena leptocephala]